MLQPGFNRNNIISMLRIVFTLLMASWAAFAASGAYQLKGPTVFLWPNGAPGSEGKTAPERWIDTAAAGQAPDPYHRVTDINNPSITAFLPPKGKANGAAFIIAPGGGHRYLVVDLEGEFVAKKLNEMGVAGFVLKSRLAKADGSTYRADVESLADVQRAIRVVRSRAKEWGVDPARVGVMGFSAGGHLAALAENRIRRGEVGFSGRCRPAKFEAGFRCIGVSGARRAGFRHYQTNTADFYFRE